MKIKLLFLTILLFLISYNLFLLYSESNKIKNIPIDLSLYYNFIDWLICIPVLIFCCIGFFFVFNRFRSSRASFKLLNKDLVKNYNKSGLISTLTISSAFSVLLCMRIVYVIFHVSLSTKIMSLSIENSLKYLFIGF